MKPVRIRFITRVTALGLACSGAALAQTAGTTIDSGATTTTTTTTATSTAPATASNPTSKLVASFADMAGSPENAASLVNGLRTGSDITLTATASSTTGSETNTGGSTSGGTSITTTTSFSPGTKPMGYGNIKIALSLARAQLAAQGVGSPTPEQLQGVLIGTTTTDGSTTQGILQMRASGMGWGQIANSMDMKLGAVMSGKTAGAASTASGSVTTASGTTTHGGKGVVTASGTSAGGSGGKHGVTTAAGGGMRGGNPHITSGLGMGSSHAASGAVNAGGSHSGGMGMGHGGGLAKGK